MILQTGQQITAVLAVLNFQLGQHRIVELVVRWTDGTKLQS